MKILTNFSVGIVLVLAGCSSGGGTTVEPFSDQLENLQNMFLAFDELESTEVAEFETSGSARYVGASAIKFASTGAVEQPDLVGEADMSVNFGTQAVTGTFEKFTTEAGVVLDGELSLNGASFDNTTVGGPITGSVDGSLSGKFRGSNVDMTFETTINDSSFAGSDAGSLGVFSVGTATTNGGAPEVVAFGSVAVVE